MESKLVPSIKKKEKSLNFNPLLCAIDVVDRRAKSEIQSETLTKNTLIRF